MAHREVDEVAVREDEFASVERAGHAASFRPVTLDEIRVRLAEDAQVEEQGS